MSAFVWEEMGVRRRLREAEADRAAVRARYDIACEIIANHLDGGSTDRARAMVERQHRLRHGFTEEASP